MVIIIFIIYCFAFFADIHHIYHKLFTVPTFATAKKNHSKKRNSCCQNAKKLTTEDWHFKS